ncbi:MAG TPA: alpha/beta hydrolase, partial [Tepidisphaeraceae bacterium]|nr:alpha/beta hydrolase [Tepidisphaeraceae bacterium]
MSFLRSLALCVAAVALPAFAADAPVKLVEPKPLTPGHQVIRLFPDGHPALKALEGADQEEKWTVQNGRVAKAVNIHVPTIELYAPAEGKANGMSVILSPGGGNKDLWVGPEGTDVAKWLNELGVTCFVHRYRLQPYGSATDALVETQRAVRIIRASAKEYGVDPRKIGHMGFSAGGEQTARLALTYDAGKADAADPVDRVSSRPDWVCLVYPGWKPDTLDMTKVPKDVPPTFLVTAGTDDVFHARQTVELYNALFEVGVKQKPKPLNLEMHIYGRGGHGGSIGPRKGIP